MQNRSKWLTQIDATHSVAEAARITLKARLTTVARFLELAANHAEKTPEHVHQLRVYTRRSLAALDMYEGVLVKKEAKWFRKWLRRIRKAAGDARDLDVFLQRYNKQAGSDHESFIREVRKRRRKAQWPILKLHMKLIPTNRFKRHVKRLRKSAKGMSDSKSARQPMGQWAQKQVSRTAARLFKAIPSRNDDLEALHRFRVRGKELRYTMELFVSAFPDEFRDSIYPQVSQLQDRLGQVNDHATACRHLGEWSDQSSGGWETDYLLKLIATERENLKQSMECFYRWWTPEFAEELESSLSRMTTAAGVNRTM